MTIWVTTKKQKNTNENFSFSFLVTWVLHTIKKEISLQRESFFFCLLKCIFPPYWIAQHTDRVGPVNVKCSWTVEPVIFESLRFIALLGLQ